VLAKALRGHYAQPNEHRLNAGVRNGFFGGKRGAENLGRHRTGEPRPTVPYLLTLERSTNTCRAVGRSSPACISDEAYAKKSRFGGLIAPPADPHLTDVRVHASRRLDA